ncbi:(2Fe-2S)-binding protein [Candidatus Laterigemmans baculatus]|uniref:(2Fe-2S)-binding protein n=1 Tax=Candidatus Laterigemmans baculatus TaxID=2770505 RepID=UPI0013DD63D6|nr:(2Fe-2S)-binding protein [Candidatus Laterigemmans baculatus]
MRDDDELCLCFHVTRRKIRNYIRIHRPRVASQLSECGGAGTGCGWCRKMLRRMLEEGGAEDERQPDAAIESWPDAETYAAGRQRHLQERRTGS